MPGSVLPSGAARTHEATLIEAADSMERFTFVSCFKRQFYTSRSLPTQLFSPEVIDALTSGVTNVVYGVCQADEVKAISFQ